MFLSPSDQEVFEVTFHLVASGIITPFPAWMGEHKATDWVVVTLCVQANLHLQMAIIQALEHLALACWLSDTLTA